MGILLVTPSNSEKEIVASEKMVPISLCSGLYIIVNSRRFYSSACRELNCLLVQRVCLFVVYLKQFKPKPFTSFFPSVVTTELTFHLWGNWSNNKAHNVDGSLNPFTINRHILVTNAYVYMLKFSPSFLELSLKKSRRMTFAT